MSNSLTLGRQVELLADGQLIDSGPAAGAVIRLGQVGSSSGGFDLGSGDPQTTVITSLLLDGERPVGRRTGNANISLPIYVRGPGFQTLMAARELVLGIVDQETWELVFALDGMQPTVFDCLRAKTNLTFTLREAAQDVLGFSVACQRLPFGRSDNVETLSILAPPGTPGGGGISYLPDIRLDGFESTTGTTIIYGTTWTLTSSKRYGSAGFNAMQTSGVSVMQRPITTVNLSSYTSLRFWTAVAGRAATRNYWVVLYDTGGHTWHLPSVSANLPGNLKYVASFVSLKTVPPPAGFNATAINRFQFKTDGAVYLDDLDAIDSTVNVIGGSRGGLYEIHAINGSARTPINVDLSRPSGGTITGGLVHRPDNSTRDYLPLVQLNPVTPLDGRTVTTLNTSLPWDGTYSVVLAIAALVGLATQSRTTTVTITQTTGSAVDTVTASRTYTPNEIGNADYLYLNRVTLPIRNIPPDNVGVNWTISITNNVGGGAYDSFTDLLFIDTQGQTVAWQNIPANTHVFIDEPDPVLVNHGKVLAGSSHAVAGSIMGQVSVLSGEPLCLDPGENKLLAHCVDGAGTLTLNYSPRWHGLRVT